MEMIGDYFGVKKSQKEWGKECGTTRKDGTSAKRMVAAAREAGFSAMVKDNASFSDIQKWLRKKIPVIVDWFSVDEGHYSVAVKLDRKYIWLADPETAKIRKMDRKIFFRVWFDFHGDALRTKDDVILRRIIIISKQESKHATHPQR